MSKTLYSFGGEYSDGTCEVLMNCIKAASVWVYIANVPLDLGPAVGAISRNNIFLAGRDYSSVVEFIVETGEFEAMLLLNGVTGALYFLPAFAISFKVLIVCDERLVVLTDDW